MSFFSWFSGKSPAKTSGNRGHAGLGEAEATVPAPSHAKSRGKTEQAQPGGSAKRKSERLERRELLYGVVREAMTRAGVLAASYKFKVLSLDPRGGQYLIMMDLARQFAGEPGRLAEIESLIAQGAKTRHDILVTAVYWRISEHVTAGLSKVGGASAQPGPSQTAGIAPKSAEKRGSQFEPLQADEVEAFKRALASVSSPAPLAPMGAVVKSGRRNPSPADFEDTEQVDSYTKASPLSGTQYGDLN